MSLNANKIKNNSKKSVPVLDAGAFPCRLLQIIDLGLQPQRPYKGEEKPPANEIMLTYELLDEFLLDENGNEDKTKPRVISEVFPIYNLKSEKAKSTKRYNTFDPTTKFNGDWSKLVGTPCIVNVVHRPRPGEPDNPYVNIGDVVSMRSKEANAAPKAVNPLVILDLDSPSMDMYNLLPDWVKTKIQAGLNYPGSKLEQLLNGGIATDKDEGVDVAW